MAQFVEQLHVPLLVGVGAAFDYHTGMIRDCSDWIKRAGMQWLHRLAQDPRRLWKRYLLNNPAFVWRVTRQFLRFQNDQSHRAAVEGFVVAEGATEWTPRTSPGGR